jgi:hypothetical protein
LGAAEPLATVTVLVLIAVAVLAVIAGMVAVGVIEISRGADAGRDIADALRGHDASTRRLADAAERVATHLERVEPMPEEVAREVRGFRSHEDD